MGTATTTSNSFYVTYYQTVVRRELCLSRRRNQSVAVATVSLVMH